MSDVTPEVVEVRVDRVEVDLSLDMLVQGLAEEAERLAEGRGEEQPDPEAAERLRNLGRLAREVNQEVRAVQRLQPRLLQRLEEGRNPPLRPNRPGRPARPRPGRPNRPNG